MITTGQFKGKCSKILFWQRRARIPWVLDYARRCTARIQKVEAIKNIAPPTIKKELHHFIGIINYYLNMWIRRSDVLALLTALTSKTAKWQWTDVEQNAFDTMKHIMARETLLAYPDFNQPFIIHTDASHKQLGAVISQGKRLIAFYSRTLSLAQTHYTTTKRELLSIVETLKEFRNILLGQ